MVVCVKPMGDHCCTYFIKILTFLRRAWLLQLLHHQMLSCTDEAAKITNAKGSERFNKSANKYIIMWWCQAMWANQKHLLVSFYEYSYMNIHILNREESLHTSLNFRRVKTLTKCIRKSWKKKKKKKTIEFLHHNN